jgi:hypothetical protein
MGFSETGRLPEAFCQPVQGVDALVMYQRR